MVRLFIIFLFIFIIQQSTYACNVCHSKNQKMVNMHKALEYKNCFTCHKLEKKKTMEELKLLRTKDDRCINCHSI